MQALLGDDREDADQSGLVSQLHWEQGVLVNSTQRLAGVLLQQPLAEWVTQWRGNGEGWESIASRLRHTTSSEVHVSGETLRRWYGDTNQKRGTE